MEGGESVLDVIYEDENMDDVEMIDVEEGEVVDDKPLAGLGQSNGGGDNAGAEESQSKNRKRRANKNKNRKKRGGPGPNVMDINRFVLDTCRRLKEKKSYMVYTAVGCLGVSAVSDLVKEVDAIQSCGGQTTADGRRSRTGGGILWNILKTRETVAYREIMKKAKEFEKQFRQQNVRQAPESNKEGSSQVAASSTTVPDAATQNELGQSGDGKRRPVHERIRAPVHTMICLEMIQRGFRLGTNFAPATNWPIFPPSFVSVFKESLQLLSYRWSFFCDTCNIDFGFII